jgi:hypothetical protein
MATGAEKAYNIDFVLDDVKCQPQTYNTILREEYMNLTLQFILRRKINKIVKEGRIFKTTIPGTRYGQVILYNNDKLYKILVEGTRIGVSIFYFFEYKKLSKFYLKVDKYWELHKNLWVENNTEKIFFEGKILKFF